MLSLEVDLPDCFGVGLRVTPTEVEEGNGAENITVTATLSAGVRGRQVATQVTVSVVGDTATEGRDFVAVAPITITIPNGSESGTGTFTLVATADAEEELGGETMRLSGTSILSSSSVPGTEVGDATVTIKDVPGVQVEPTSRHLNEGGTATYAITLITPPTGNVTITPPVTTAAR